jgi:hypothetical protein
MTFCAICKSNTFSSKGSSSCSFCDDGKFSGEGSSDCSPCAAGSYRSEGMIACAHCKSNTFSSEGAANCSKCTYPLVPNPTRSQCVACPDGERPSKGQCVPCPAAAGIVCAGGKLHIEERFWFDTTVSLTAPHQHVSGHPVCVPWLLPGQNFRFNPKAGRPPAVFHGRSSFLRFRPTAVLR